MSWRQQTGSTGIEGKPVPKSSSEGMTVDRWRDERPLQVNRRKLWNTRLPEDPRLPTGLSVKEPLIRLTRRRQLGKTGWGRGARAVS